MEAREGDRLVVEGAKVGQAPRGGQVLEVITGPQGQHYRVRWDDGHESVFFPSSDARVEQAASP
ncbi:MAG: DUF1918 domain-containing protein [Actinomycetota bacterium]|nr:DUF1918 domain-containing protein [Actinomycetota bacterium]